jgi:hypothetical protein
MHDAVSTTAKRCLPVALILALSAWITFTSAGMGDYPADAQVAVNALAHGHISAFVHARSAMGPFSIVLRAPFAALGGGDPQAAYLWGALPCVIAAGLLGLYLAGLARRRGSTLPAQVGLVAVCVFNPLTFVALQQGHPEEILTAALAVGAVAVASRGHSRRTALLLGLAIASKQWAVIATLPVLMALPSRRVRVALGAAGVVLALTLPSVFAAPGSFASTQHDLASTTRFVDAWSAWYPFAGAEAGKLVHAHGGITVEPYKGGSALIGRYSHPLIVLVAIAIPAALALRRRRIGLSGPDAMALLALLALVRCALDPVDNLYYHAPLLLALVGWDALASGGLPLRGLAAAAVGTVLWRWGTQISDPHVLNALYLAVIVPAAFGLAIALLHRPGPLTWRAPSRRAGSPRPAGAG